MYSPPLRRNTATGPIVVGLGRSTVRRYASLVLPIRQGSPDFVHVAEPRFDRDTVLDL
jgi:hypothetical protein